MTTVLKARSVCLYLVYVTVFRYILLSRALRGEESVNNGRDTTSGLAYNHPTRCLTAYGDGKGVWSAS
eukprot:3508905-Prymnesium_polylepis.1